MGWGRTEQAHSFLHCTLFPEDYEMRRMFATLARSLEQVAESYSNDLVNRSLLRQTGDE
jgi:hypothetical protein